MKLSHALPCALLTAAAVCPHAHAGSVQVMLFGQPCQLQGPASVSDAQLKVIHQVSPEQTPLGDSVQVLRTSLERLKPSAEMPEVLGRYLEQRAKAVGTRISFEEALQSARRNRSSQEFSNAIQPMVHPRRLKGLARQFEKALQAGNSPSAWEQIRLDFAEVSGPDGEEDFHRAVRKLKVIYQCSFESFDEEQTGAEQPSTSGKSLQQPAANH
jgi:hypothetical protein